MFYQDACVHVHRLVYIPAAGDTCNLWEGALQEHVFLVIHNVDTSPVDSNDNIILGQARAREAIGLKELGEEQWPFELGVEHHSLSNSVAVNSILDIWGL